ncbi:MAG: hypothetical protein M1348_02385 [Candidatus Parvarchaeota archaeon]|nr:hypothetical protein [Candidatus Parvarchaeota archaeon]
MQQGEHAQFFACNEVYSPSVLYALKKYRGINKAIMLCGDGVHVLGLYQYLRKGNNIKRIDVIDNNGAQLKVFMDLIDEINAVDDFRDRRKKLEEKLAIEWMCSTNFRCNYRNLPKPEDSLHSARFYLHRADIVEYLQRLTGKDAGRYYVYLSNAPFSAWLNDYDSSWLLSYIASSKIFKGGTVVHIQYHLDRPLFLVKKNGLLKMSPYVKSVHESVLGEKFEIKETTEGGYHVYMTDKPADPKICHSRII